MIACKYWGMQLLNFISQQEPGRKNPRGDFLQIDTTNILFICGGAFSGLERIINKRMDAASIGFGAQMKKNVEDAQVQGQYFDSAIPKDLVRSRCSKHRVHCLLIGCSCTKG